MTDTYPPDWVMPLTTVLLHATYLGSGFISRGGNATIICDASTKILELKIHLLDTIGIPGADHDKYNIYYANSLQQINEDYLLEIVIVDWATRFEELFS
ncbi:hypothetical protein LPJ71_005662, partial [Coemansia sp. S17]